MIRVSKKLNPKILLRAFVFVMASFLCLFIGCKPDIKEESYAVLNDVFLQSVDTMGYHGSILPETVYKKGRFTMRDSHFVKQPYLILENKPLDTIYDWGKTIEKELLKEGFSLKEITRLKTPKDYKWDANRLKQCGRYLVIDMIDHKNTSITIVGHIWFSKVIFHPDGDKAFFLFEKGTSVGKKSFVVSMVWLKKVNGVWKITRNDLGSIS